MSRTDKDRPWWVKALDPTWPREPGHDHVNLYTGAPQDCTINVVPHPERWWSMPCAWSLVHYAPDAVPRVMRRSMYWAPQRVRTRNVLRRLVDEYNTFGYVDDQDVQPANHKHAPARGGHWN